MGIADKLKNALVQHKEQAEQAIDKGVAAVDKKTGGQHSEQMQSAAKKAKEAIENLHET